MNTLAYILIRVESVKELATRRLTSRNLSLGSSKLYQYLPPAWWLPWDDCPITILYLQNMLHVCEGLLNTGYLGYAPDKGVEAIARVRKNMFRFHHNACSFNETTCIW